MSPTRCKNLFSYPLHPQGNTKVENIHDFLKGTLTKFVDNNDLEWDKLLPFACYCYNRFPNNNGTESPFFLIFEWDPEEGCLSHHNNSNRYYGTNERKILLEELYKLWKHHAKYPKKLHQRDEHTDQQITKNNPKFEMGHLVMIKNHAHHTFESKYLPDSRILKYSKIAPSWSNVKWKAKKDKYKWCKTL